MSPQLCLTCRRIPASFFSERYDKHESPKMFTGPAISLQPYNRMCEAVPTGCTLCSILIGENPFKLSNQYPPYDLDYEPVVLRRARIDPFQGLALYIGMDDISHSIFYRIPRSWTNIPPARRNYLVDNVRIIKHWIDDCETGHSKCTSGNQDFIPTRLLDLHAFKESQDVKLVVLELNGSQKVRYTALSHCWGPENLHPIRTDKENLQQRKTRIAFKDLSQTFRDAVSVTRDLAVRYLWIDSLCIIQNDEDDWIEEASKMAEVYGGSICTLCALGAEDSTKGFSINADIQKLNPFIDLDFEREPHRVRVFESEPNPWHTEYGDDSYRRGAHGSKPLRTRSWALQERELSPRNVHFSGDYILWECQEMKGSNQIPWHMQEPVDDFKPIPLRNHPSESLALDGPVFLRDRWYGLIEDYASRSLTKERDKLPALSGLASKYQKHFPGQYLAGLWSCHLPAALLWRTVTQDYSDSDKRHVLWRPSSYIAPSWSWASLVGRISYDSQRLSYFSNHEDMTVGQGEDSEFDFAGLIVKCIDVQLKGVSPFGEIRDASLLLHGVKIVPLPHRQVVLDAVGDFSQCRVIIDQDGANAGIFYPDLVVELEDIAPKFCMSIRSEPVASSQINMPSRELYEEDYLELIGKLDMGLALAQVSAKDNVFRRIGLVRWVRKSFYEGINPSVVTLI